MLIRRPRGLSPWSVGFALVLGAVGGVYIWGPGLTHYLNTDPEVLAFRKQAAAERELQKSIKKE